MRKYSTGMKLKNGNTLRKDVSPGATSGISFKSRPQVGKINLDTSPNRESRTGSSRRSTSRPASG